jgi:hypothetical protein
VCLRVHVCSVRRTSPRALYDSLSESRVRRNLFSDRPLECCERYRCLRRQHTVHDDDMMWIATDEHRVDAAEIRTMQTQQPEGQTEEDEEKPPGQNEHDRG